MRLETELQVKLWGFSRCPAMCEQLSDSLFTDLSWRSGTRGQDTMWVQSEAVLKELMEDLS